MPDPLDPLTSYLASRDAPCPACGYNLRGCTSPACPECGHALHLTLETRRYSDRARRNIVLFAAIVLAWSGAYVLEMAYFAYQRIFTGLFAGAPSWYSVQTFMGLICNLTVCIIVARQLRGFLARRDRTDAAFERLLHTTVAACTIEILAQLVSLAVWFARSF